MKIINILTGLELRMRLPREMFFLFHWGSRFDLRTAWESFLTQRFAFKSSLILATKPLPE